MSRSTVGRMQSLLVYIAAGTFAAVVLGPLATVIAVVDRFRHPRD